MRRHELLVAGSRCGSLGRATAGNGRYASVLGAVTCDFITHAAVQQRDGPAYIRLRRPAEVWLDRGEIAQNLAGDKSLDLLLPAKMQARDLAVLPNV